MNTTKNQYAATGTVFAGRGTLGLITGYNPSLVDLYFQMFDAAAIVPGDVPSVNAILVPAGANFSFVPTPLASSIGVALLWGVSSTPATYTAAATSFWVHSEYSTVAV